MNGFKQITDSLRSECTADKINLLAHLQALIEQSSHKLSTQDIAVLSDFVFDEINKYTEELKTASCYKDKDAVFMCGNSLIGITTQLYHSPADMPEDKLELIRHFLDKVKEERYLENTVDELFEQERIEEAYVSRLISFASGTYDEYHRGRALVGLDHYKHDLGKLTQKAHELLGEYLESEAERYIGKDYLGEDAANNIELIADLLRYFKSADTEQLLTRILGLGLDNVSFYAVGSLAHIGADIPQDAVTLLARSDVYAHMTYHTLKEHGKEGMFPPECTSPEYLAKSDLIHWLTYPTELGKVPDGIEYIGKIGYLFKKEVYYVFKYISDSENLGDELKNRWLIGWSSDDGGTFSQFDLYSEYEKETAEKTLKNIKKHLIG